MDATRTAPLVRMAVLMALVVLFTGWWCGSAWATAGVPSNELDPTFGADGVVITNLPSSTETIWDLAVQSDGRIIVMGSRVGDFVVLRYGPNGRLDPSFHASAHSFGTVLAVQPDQKIILGGTVGSYLDVQFALQRLNTDGTLDVTFGRHGEVTTRFPLDSRLKDIVVQPDGKIVTAGEVFGTGAEGFVFARYLPNGDLDPSFGLGGIEKVELGPDDHVLAGLALQPDGKIVANGHIPDSPGSLLHHLGIVRLEEDGSLDPTFGDGGIVIMTEFDYFTTSSLALQPDGGILSSGSYYNLGNTRTEFGLVRHLSDGTLDVGFGGGGLAHLDVAGLGSWPNALAVQPNGLIVQAGYSPDEGDAQDADVVWWESNGALHSERDTGLFGFTSSANAVFVQDGKAVVGGSGSSSYDDQRFGLARFLSN